MADQPFDNPRQTLGERLRQLLHRLGVWWRQDSGGLAERAKQIFDTTSDQVLQRAEETRRAVKLRMAIMDVEHNLNRLYAQIGKLSCDAAPEDSEEIPIRGDLADKLSLAREYRARLAALREEQREQTP
jgi:hypothetical protein